MWQPPSGLLLQVSPRKWSTVVQWRLCVERVRWGILWKYKTTFPRYIVKLFSGLKSFLVKPRYRNKYKTCTPGNEWTKDDKFKINEHYKNECKARGSFWQAWKVKKAKTHEINIFILGNKCLRNYCGFQSDNSCNLSGAFYERILYFIANGAWNLHELLRL